MFLLNIAVAADPLATTGGGSVYDFIGSNAVLLGFIFTSLWSWLTSKGYKAVASVNQIKNASDVKLAPNQAKDLAVKLFRKHLPFIPLFVAEIIVQFLFDLMKTDSIIAKNDVKLKVV